MKTNYLTCAVLMLLLSVFSCSKDDDAKIYPEENPLALFLEKTGYDETTSEFVNDIFLEQGFKFRPKVKGVINAVIAKIPDDATDLRITIWNATTQSVVKTYSIPTVVEGVEARLDIEPLLVVPEETYVITFNGNDSYSRRKTNSGVAEFPVETGNISIEKVVYHQGSQQSYPNADLPNAYWGDVSFVFQQTE